MFDYAGVLLLALLGVGCLAAGLARTNFVLLIVGGVLVAVAAIWAVVGRARRGSIVP